MPKSENKYVVKVFNWLEFHLSEMTCYKIHALDTDYFPGHCWCFIGCGSFNRHHNRQGNEKMQNHQFSFTNYHAIDYCTEHPCGWPWRSSA